LRAASRQKSMRTLRKATSSFALLLMATSAIAIAKPPSVAILDAHARAGGSNKALARRIAYDLFLKSWSVQVLNVYADSIPGHSVVGLRLSCKKFHGAVSRAKFFGEVQDLVRESFAAAPVEEVDVYATVPLVVGRDVVVAGDLARPTSRNVFTVTVRRGESMSSLAQRLQAKRGVFVDEDWARAALK